MVNLKLVAFWVVLAVISGFINLEYPGEYSAKLLESVIFLGALSLISELLLKGIAIARMRDEKSKYFANKTLSISYILVSVLILTRIWIEKPETLMVSYGLIGAGIAIAMQDIFRNFMGGIAIVTNRLYKTGDRIEINSKIGDVMDIGMFYTTLMEIEGWVGGDQTTGRIVMMPNSEVITHSIKNYTKDYMFIWDEISIPVTYGSNFKKAEELFLKVLREMTENNSKDAEKEISKIKSKYYFDKRNVNPEIFIGLNDNWVTFTLRYVVPVKARRGVKSGIYRNILEIVSKEKDITIASTTMNITGFPEVKVNLKK